MLKNLRSLFFVEDEKAAANKKKAPSAGKIKNDTAPVVQKKKFNVNGKVSNKFTQILFEALERNNLDGFDYMEFRQSVLSLKKVQLDEATRFQSAAAMAASMGITGEQIAQSALHYVNILKQEDKKFKQALKKQNQSKIGSKEESLKELDRIVKEKTAQIQKLTKEIEVHQKDGVKLRKTIDEATIKINQTEADFSVSYVSLVQQIEGDVDKIKQYLK